VPRIAFARISQETNGLSPLRTEVTDFRRTHFLEGRALLRACGPREVEARGFLRNAELSGFVRAARRVGAGRVEPVPLFSAWAVPGGKVSAGALEWFREHLAARLREAGPLDGLFLSLHGAMLAEGEPDPEATLVRAAREVVGDVPIGVSLDLHAQLTRNLVEQVDVLGAYRTNPHRDHARTGYRVGGMLVRKVLGEQDPVVAWRALPMVWGGGTTMDFLRPMRPLFRRMRQLERDPRVLYCSLFMSHLWSDLPDPGWAVCVVTDGDRELSEHLADTLADATWAVRDVPVPSIPTGREAVRQAREARWRRRLGTVCISDTSDMVSCGAAGESTHLLRILRDEATDLRCYAPVCDAEVVGTLWGRPVGAPVDIEVGGKRLPELSPPLRVRGTLRRKQPDRGFGREIVIDDGRLAVVVTEAPPLAMKPSFYRALGLPVTRADVCVVKSLFPFRLYFALHSRLSIYAHTRGMTDLDWRRLPIEAPVHPKARLGSWRAGDQRRRRA